MMDNQVVVVASGRYSALLILLHWSTAILVLVAYALSGKGSQLSKDPFGLHFAFGLLVLMVTVARVAARACGRSPARITSGVPQLVRLRKAAHGMLYLLLVTVPLMGWYTASRMDVSVKLFTLTLPAITMRSPDGAPGALGELHRAGGNLIIWFAGLHVVSVLWHQYIVKDGILKRMSLF